MTSNIEQIKKILKEKQYRKINGILVDAQSANAILSVHKALSKENQKSYEEIIEKDIGKAGRIAWRLVG